jgi:cytochrome P450
MATTHTGQSKSQSCPRDLHPRLSYSCFSVVPARYLPILRFPILAASLCAAAYTVPGMPQSQIAVRPTHRLPPGPRGLKLLRSSFTMGNDWSGFLSRCAREYGDVIYFRFLNVPICLVVHPDSIEKILVKDQANFLKARDYRALRSILGNGLLTSEGEFWQAQRKLIQPAFRHENIVTYAQVMTQAAASMLTEWKPGETRDIHADMMALTLEIVAKSLFGSDVSEAARGIGHAMAIVMDLFIT